MEIHIGDRVAEVELVSKEDNKVVLTIDGKPFEADVVMACLLYTSPSPRDTR